MSIRGQIVCLLLCSCPFGCSDSGPVTASRAQRAFDEGDYAKAWKLASQIPADAPDWPKGQLILGTVALDEGDVQIGLQHLYAIKRDGSPESIEAARMAARVEQQSGRLSMAIDAYAYVVDQDSDDVRALSELVDLETGTHQRWEADRHLAELAKLQRLSFKQLVHYTDYDRTDPNAAAFLARCAANAPNDPAVNLGLAVEDVSKKDFAAARRRLELAIKADSNLGTAQALLGEVLLQTSDGQLPNWHNRLPESVRDHPGIWMVRGLWAVQREQEEIAARCFWEGVRQIPTSHRAVYQLGRVMTSLDPEIGRPIAGQAHELYEFREQLSEALNFPDRDERALRKVINQLLTWGRDRETWLWASLAQRKYAKSDWPDDVLTRLNHFPEPDAPRIRGPFDIAATYDLSHYPRFDDLRVAPPSPADVQPAPIIAADIRFVDEAAKLGIDFAFDPGQVPEIDGVRMFETTGGGVGVIDFDCDGWPDLYFTQGESWPAHSDVPAPSAIHHDCLYRNLASRFHEVTEEAHLLPEDGYGQGCSAGDFNNDGFPDLYVANIGRNQLLMNNGDGTFSDLTAELGIEAEAWTTSCLIADLNADGHPDLFDVNYLEGDELFRMVCIEDHCSPEAYVDAPDHLHLSQGDGSVRFIDRGDTEPGGAGLAVVAFRMEPLPDVFDHKTAESTTEANRASERSPSAATSHVTPEEERLTLFIANDHEPNFLLRNASAASPGNIALTDVGYLSGLAIDRDGRKNACMGVASGDLDGDGRLDLFVTNYKDEANNYYRQEAGGLFTDAIARTGLLSVSLPFVGWGTQFLDADNDGQLDLVVTNGHVADFGDDGEEDAMPTHFFHNMGDARFEQLSPDRIGPFFERRGFGRSLATLDWNRDGRTDFVLSSIGSPASLVTNHSADARSHFTIRLHAVTTARDAIGTFVTITTAAGTTRKQLTAGDGYQVTNERVLRFGLGEARDVTEVVIEWPGGSRQSLGAFDANMVVDVVEGRQRISAREATARRAN